MVAASRMVAIVWLTCIPVAAQGPSLGNYPLPPGIRELDFIGPLIVDPAPHRGGQVLVVNILPNLRSGETEDQRGIDLAVNPSAPDDLAASWWPMLPDPVPAGPPPYPIQAPRPLSNSRDGGYAWTENHILVVPGAGTSGNGEFFREVNVEFAGAGGHLYAGVQRFDAYGAPWGFGHLMRSADPFGSAEAAAILHSLGHVQPYLAVTTLFAADENRDRILVGYPDHRRASAVFEPDWEGRIATVAHSRDARMASGEEGFARRLIQPARDRHRWGGKEVRVSAHRNGTAYAIYSAHLGRRDLVDGYGLADVMVFRNDAGTADEPAFSALTDPSDGLPGRLMAQDRRLYTEAYFDGGVFVDSRQGDLDIAVDPENADLVYAAWTDSDAVSSSTLHLSRSVNGGGVWRELLTLADAVNPALAVTAGGTAGLLYQQVTGGPAARRWQTVLRRNRPEWPTDWSNLVLSEAPYDPDFPLYRRREYAIDLETAGETFYGAFTESNVPDHAHFPRGVRYQRNADFTTHRLLDLDGATRVSPSFDPFFFKVTPGAAIPGLCGLPGALSPCRGGIYFDFGRIVFEIDRLPFFALDSLPRNCLVKFACPGCRETTLCPPYHHIFLEGLDPAEWDVGLYDSAGQSVKRRITPIPGGMAISFRPEKARFREKDIGDYRLGFATKGQIAKRRFAVKTRLEVSDYPRPGQKAVR